MNKNLNILFEKIINDSSFTQNMKKKKNLKDLYEYCFSYVEGYTLKEFEEFLRFIIIINKRISGKIRNLSEEEISSISGVTNFSSHSSKVIAALMSGLLFTNCSKNSLTVTVSHEVMKYSFTLSIYWFKVLF